MRRRRRSAALPGCGGCPCVVVSAAPFKRSCWEIIDVRLVPPGGRQAGISHAWPHYARTLPDDASGDNAPACRAAGAGMRAKAS